MKKAIFYGGFHNAGAISINVTDDQARELKETDGDFLGLSYILTPGQYKRLNKHFCGVRGCLCGGVNRAKWEIN